DVHIEVPIRNLAAPEPDTLHDPGGRQTVHDDLMSGLHDAVNGAPPVRLHGPDDVAEDGSVGERGAHTKRLQRRRWRAAAALHDDPALQPSGGPGGWRDAPP